MKRLKFIELGFKKNFDTLIVVVGVICLIIGLIAGFGFANERLLSLAGFSAVLTTFPQFRNLFYNNSFLWNKKGGNLKINSKSKNIVFSELDSFKFNENQLSISKKNKTKLEFNLADIHDEDISKLEAILDINIKKQ